MRTVDKNDSCNSLKEKEYLDLAIITPELQKRGGAERFIIECLVRWQNIHSLTVYSTSFNDELYEEVGLTRMIKKLLTPRFEGPHATLLNAVLLPKIWEKQIGKHDIYHTHLWPTHLLNLHPMVWYPHEPLRLLYDLRFSQHEEDSIESLQKKIHFYPKQTYESIESGQYEATLAAIKAYDQTGRPDRVVGNSKYTSQYIEHAYGYPVTDYVYPGVPVDDMIELPGTNDIVLTIGQLWPHKRMRIIIEAISQVENVQLYIIGSGPEKKHLSKVAEHMGVADRVFFLHGLDNEEVKILLARCLCVVFTPTREPFGIVALEALAAGKPLIAANEGGYTEVVDDQCAILTPPLPGAIAKAIQSLKDDPELAKRLGQHGREVAARYSWDRTAQELLTIIEETHVDWVCETAPAAESGAIFAVHYFLWYKEGFGSAHWCDNPTEGWVTDTPELGYYASLQGETLNAHLDMLEESGVDAVIFNIHVDEENGLEIYQTEAARRMMQLADSRSSHLRFMINLCFYTRDNDQIDSAFTIIKKDLCVKSNYLTLKDAPVLMVFWSGTFDGDLEFVERLRINSMHFFRIGSFMRPIDPGAEAHKTFDLFNSYSLFSPLEMVAPDKWEDLWQKEYDVSGANSGLKCLTIEPGYDDSHLLDPSRSHAIRTVPHDNGDTYKQTMNFALQQDNPAFIFINSFNEYHENTHIERSKNNGSLYIDMTKEFIKQARSKWEFVAQDAVEDRHNVKKES